MLQGERVRLRPIRESDLEAFYSAHVDIRNRGAFFPLGIMSESKVRQEFAETGFWQREEGTLLIMTDEDEMAGHIEFFKPVDYWDAFELSYQLYDDRFAGRGYVTDAVQLMVDYLFGAKKQHRIQLDIVPENAASRRIAEKCGFVLEGTARGALFTAAATRTSRSTPCCGPIPDPGTTPRRRAEGTHRAASPSCWANGPTSIGPTPGRTRSCVA